MKIAEVPAEVMKEINEAAEKLSKLFSPEDAKTYTFSPINIWHNGQYNEGMSIEFQLGKNGSGTYTSNFLCDWAERLHATDFDIVFEKGKIFVRFKVYYSDNLKKGKAMFFTDNEINQLWAAMVHHIAACESAGFTLQDMPTCAALAQRLNPEK